jgi:hypothetical protein
MQDCLNLLLPFFKEPNSKIAELKDIYEEILEHVSKLRTNLKMFEHVLNIAQFLHTLLRENVFHLNFIAPVFER